MAAAEPTPRPFPEPAAHLNEAGAAITAFLDFHRDAVLRKLDGLSDADLRRSVVPSGWTPLALVKHLAYTERRWLQWGFMGQAVPDPWGDCADRANRGRWGVDPGERADHVLTFYRKTCQRSREIVAAHQLSDLARSGGRFNPPDTHPALIWIVVHLLQEYARHVGHLDVVRELMDGGVGE